MTIINMQKLYTTQHQLQTHEGLDVAQFTAQFKTWPTGHPTATQSSDRITE